MSGGSYVNLGALTYDDTELTYAIWVYTTSTQTYSRILDFGNGVGTNAGGNNHLLVFYGTTGKVALNLFDNGVNLGEVVDTVALALNTWVHLTATISGAGTQISIYRDGVLTVTGSLPFSGAVKTRSNCLVGQSNWPSPTEYFNGRLADFLVFERALSATEVYGLKRGVLYESNTLISAISCYPYTPSCPCVAGEYFDIQNWVCTACATGTYQSASGASVCDGCPANT
eukprot:1227542-Rhodomonas_salina.1